MRTVIAILALLIPGVLTAQEADSASVYKITKLRINSAHADFSPVFYGEGIVFASTRPHNYGVVHYDKNKEQLLDLYFTQNGKKGLKNPVPFSKTLNTKLHEGPASFTADGKKVYYTGNATNDKDRLMIYQADRAGEEWENAKPLFSSKDASMAHPAVSPDGTMMIFASDMAGGVGKTDLYVSYLEDGVWTQPENIGEQINTTGNERFPFIDAEGVVYFATDGREDNLGGLDIIKAIPLEDGYHVEPLNEFNSSADDFGFIADESGRSGYFSSNREGVDNIYRFDVNFPGLPPCDTIPERYCYVFFDEEYTPEADTFGVYYEWIFEDGIKKRGVEVEHCFKKHGLYEVKLTEVDSITDSVLQVVAVYSLPVDQLFFGQNDTVQARQPLSFDASGSFFDEYEVNQYFWAMGDGTFKKGPKVQHPYVKEGEYTIELGAEAVHQKTGEKMTVCSKRRIYVTNEIRAENVKSISAPPASTTPDPAPTATSDKPSAMAAVPEKPEERVGEVKAIYKIQIAASKTPIPKGNSLFSKVDDLEEEKGEDGYYRYFTGKYETKEEADEQRRKLIDKGIKGAFIKKFAPK